MRATHAPTRNYAAVVSSKNSIATRTPNWPQHIVKPQLQIKATHNQAGKSRPKQKSTTDDEGKATLPSWGSGVGAPDGAPW